LDPWILFAVIFLWTPPHFWALALFREGDYARAGVPMMPNARGVASTKRQIFAYAIALALSGVAPVATGLGGVFYFVVAAALGGWFVWLAYGVLNADANDKGPAKRLFKFSILYLFAIFAALLVEKVAAYV
ncbi:MAG: UbiA family prenyltransferase, partial [Planctomycetota bacterium]